MPECGLTVDKQRHSLVSQAGLKLILSHYCVVCAIHLNQTKLLKSLYIECS